MLGTGLELAVAAKAGELALPKLNGLGGAGMLDCGEEARPVGEEA